MPVMIFLNACLSNKVLFLPVVTVSGLWSFMVKSHEMPNSTGSDDRDLVKSSYSQAEKFARFYTFVWFVNPSSTTSFLNEWTNWIQFDFQWFPRLWWLCAIPISSLDLLWVVSCRFWRRAIKKVLEFVCMAFAVVAWDGLAFSKTVDLVVLYSTRGQLNPFLSQLYRGFDNSGLFKTLGVRILIRFCRIFPFVTFRTMTGRLSF